MAEWGHSITPSVLAENGRYAEMMSGLVSFIKVCIINHVLQEKYLKVYMSMAHQSKPAMPLVPPRYRCVSCVVRRHRKR